MNCHVVLPLRSPHLFQQSHAYIVKLITFQSTQRFISFSCQFNATAHYTIQQLISCLYIIVRTMNSPKREKIKLSLNLRIRKIT